MYVRRRIVALLVLLALLVGVGFGVKALVGALGGLVRGTDAAAVTADPTGEETPAQPTACARSDVDADLTAPAEATAGGSVAFTLVVENTGTEACLLDVGAEALDLVVTSGDDEVWSSTRCPAGPGERPLLLAPDDGTEVAVEWSGRRASPECAGATAGAGTYQVEARVAGKDAGEAVFVLR